MPRDSDPLREATRLLVDGTNLLHALARDGGRLPAAALIGRIRAFVPPGVAVTIVLDGPPAPGATERRVTSGIEVRHANRRSADDVLRDLVAVEPQTALVVTDDRELAGSVRAAGARVTGTHWLAERLASQRLEAPAAGRTRAPAPPRPGAGRGAPSPTGPADAPDNERRWHPGRGATRKKGNPRRGHQAP